MVETKFKHSDIGLIPEDWETRYVKEFTDCTAGGTPSTKVDGYWGGDIPWMNSGELNKRKIYYTQNFITKRGLENSSTKIIPKNCVLIGLAGQGKTRGTVAINKIELSINQSIGVFYPNSIFNYNYLFYNLQKRYNELRLLSSGDGGRGGLNLNILKNLVIPLPPLPEQQVIAEVLSDTDNWIESLEKLIAKKQLIKQGAMQQLLTPKEDWEVKKLGEMSQIYTGNKNNQDKVEDGHYPFFVRSQKVERINSYSYEGEAILIPGEGNLGNIFHYINGKFDFHQRVYKVSAFKGINGKYLYWYFRMYFGQHALQNTVKATVDSIRLPTLQEFEILFPSIEEQIQIATILSDMDIEIEALKHRLAKAKQIKQGLMQELLTGRIRLA